jgi:methylated-DNA-[protein]-cysteine S-methyltransferase
MKNIFVYEFKFCNCKPFKVVIAEEDEKICKILVNSEKIYDDFFNAETPLLKETSKQLGEYLNKKRKSFDLPLILHGTDFQKKVWNVLQDIPYGETRSYGEVASMAGNPKAYRAVGNANNRNQIHIVIPCHRVIGSNGGLTGYAAGLEIKQNLLELESVNLFNLQNTAL